MSRRAIARGLAALCAAAIAGPAAFACSDDERPLFGCQTLDAKGELSENSISICGVESDDQMGSKSMRYVYETPKGEELSYPPDPAEGRAKLFFHHYFKAGLYRARVRFENGGYSYRVFFDDTPPSTEPDTVNGPDAGVEVLKKGKVIARISCGERPASYFEDIRRGTACDLQNPYGEKACGENAPELK
jgi:hypothetical protein